MDNLSLIANAVAEQAEINTLPKEFPVTSLESYMDVVISDDTKPIK